LLVVSSTRKTFWWQEKSGETNWGSDFFKTEFDFDPLCKTEGEATAEV